IERLVAQVRRRLTPASTGAVGRLRLRTHSTQLLRWISSPSDLSYKSWSIAEVMVYSAQEVIMRTTAPQGAEAMGKFSVQFQVVNNGDLEWCIVALCRSTRFVVRPSPAWWTRAPRCWSCPNPWSSGWAYA